MLRLKNTGIFHISKTGGHYIQALLEYNEMKYTRVYAMTNMQCPQTFAHEIVDARSDEMHHLPMPQNRIELDYRVIVVRHPVTWYPSYFAHKHGLRDDVNDFTSWNCNKDFDKKCMAPAFDQFMSKVMLCYPAPFLYQLYSVYENLPKVTHIVHMENLFEELRPIIKESEGIDMKNLDKRIHEDKHPEVSPEMTQHILNYESPTIERYYGESTPSKA